jgi:hypothetical protein
MQAPIPAHAYDPSAPSRDMGLYGPSTPNRYSEYPTGGMPAYFDGVAGAARYVNFFHRDDFALGWWEWDQNLKPNTEANYDYRTGPGEEEIYTRGTIVEQRLYLPQDTHEIFSFITEGRSLALGAQNGVGGAFRTLEEVDLRAGPFFFGSAHKDHSGQFRSTNMKRHLFWERTLQVMQLK